MKSQNKSWLDKNEYPFKSNYFDLPIGKMHYVDEGTGAPIVFVHGNPGWSYEFRKSIKELSKTNRCIAADHIGFGLSDKPFDWNYLPKNHADNFERFINHLKLDKFVLVVNDWGGPIGLSYAVNNPERIKHLMITNTWMWSVKNNPSSKRFSNFAGGMIGRFLIKNFNFFGKVIIKNCLGNKKYFDPAIYKHLEKPNDRKGCWTFPKQIVESDDWVHSLWQKRNNIRDLPKSFIWGMKDFAFSEKDLKTWIEEFKPETVIKLDDVGHYPYEEATSIFNEQLKNTST
ncbi:alpha/beta fold hydrolase [Flagellimonas pacifica]|uniref:Haloalkane dehalogenase n=1 Tax=Flagellimonas pacifica TaxID=1247520 RepID=A0A285MTZ5_9FLAO|nr:alpha/beta fold hydrolase [Allomuricauda parva]SNZ00598.1 haloalkane dehalogenase [Allomuricauda parva]